MRDFIASLCVAIFTFMSHPIACSKRFFEANLTQAGKDISAVAKSTGCSVPPEYFTVISSDYALRLLCLDVYVGRPVSSWVLHPCHSWISAVCIDSKGNRVVNDFRIYNPAASDLEGQARLEIA